MVTILDWDEAAQTADEQLEWEDNWDDEEDDDDFAKRLRAELEKYNSNK